MSIWMSKEALGPQECGQPSFTFYKACWLKRLYILWRILLHGYFFVNISNPGKFIYQRNLVKVIITMKTYYRFRHKPGLGVGSFKITMWAPFVVLILRKTIYIWKMRWNTATFIVTFPVIQIIYFDRLVLEVWNEVFYIHPFKSCKLPSHDLSLPAFQRSFNTDLRVLHYNMVIIIK